MIFGLIRLLKALLLLQVAYTASAVSGKLIYNVVTRQSTDQKLNRVFDLRIPLAGKYNTIQITIR